MVLNFSQLSLPQVGGAPVDPIKIFEALPRIPGAPNDLWRGQADALQQWHDERLKNDVLVSLNTGAGKTLVGLLIAKSLVNEGLQNVLYVCPTIDLVNQTAREAGKLGIPYTLRTQGDFSNDLFESQKTFCITTYAAVFNGLSALRRRFFPEAIIFDDAHVAEVSLRDSFTIRLERVKNSQIFDAFVEVFRPHFELLNRGREFAETVSGSSPSSSLMMVPPFITRLAKDQINAILSRFSLENMDEHKYNYPNIRDKFDKCAFVFGSGICEISPPFLPSLAVDIFDRPVRRVYLSATLTSRIDVIRAFGRRPEVTIEPRNDAGNGERLVIMGRGLAEKDIDESLARNLSARAKVLITTPNYRSAQRWANVATPPNVSEFGQKLELFRHSGRGAFVLVSRVDGIDLPHETCRVMIMDGLPVSAGF